MVKYKVFPQNWLKGVPHMAVRHVA
jgi:hypothetical protein